MTYNSDNPLRVFTSFSGYDSQLLALERLHRSFPDFEYTCVGWSEIDKYAIQAAGISKTQQYKLAGNSIVVACLYDLFRKMFVETENEERQLTLF